MNGQEAFPEVVLQHPVDTYIGKIGHHAYNTGDEVYVQPENKYTLGPRRR